MMNSPLTGRHRHEAAAFAPHASSTSCKRIHLRAPLPQLPPCATVFVFPAVAYVAAAFYLLFTRSPRSLPSPAGGRRHSELDPRA